MATTESKTDWIPVLAQIKSVVEFIGNDRGGAAYTHQQFLKRCPIVAQTAAGIGLKNANSTISSANAENVQIFSDVLSAVPVVGLLKSCYHLLSKDRDSAVDAAVASTRSAVVMAAGHFGKQFGGLPTAVGSAFATGFVFDLLGTTLAQRPFGLIFMMKTALNYPSPGVIFDTFAVSLADCLTGALMPEKLELSLCVLPAPILGSVSAPMFEPPPVKYFEEFEGTASTVMSKFLNNDFLGSKESLFTSFTEDSETNTSYNPSPAPDASGDAHSMEINDNLDSSGVMDINHVFSFMTSEVNLLDPVTKKFQPAIVSMIEMPSKYFVYTGVFKFEDVHRGALNLVLRHGMDLEKVVPDFKLDNLPAGARKLIRHMQNCPDSKAKEILNSLDKMMKQNSKIHNELIHLQMILFDFLTDAITEENYLGEYRDHRGRSRSAWKIVNKLEKEQCLLTHLGYYSHKPNAVITKDFREIASVQFISLEEAKRSAVKCRTKLT